jgi:arsenate reductase-like glutaredoxin family protein
MRKNKYSCLLFALFFTFLFVLTNCSSVKGASIYTVNARPAISQTIVKVYEQPPAQYELIGIVSATGHVAGVMGFGVDEEKSKELLTNELMKQAAKIGANGLLSIDFSMITSGGMVYGVPIRRISGVTGHGIAINVIRE